MRFDWGSSGMVCLLRLVGWGILAGLENLRQLCSHVLWGFCLSCGLTSPRTLSFFNMVSRSQDSKKWKLQGLLSLRSQSHMILLPLRSIGQSVSRPSRFKGKGKSSFHWEDQHVHIDVKEIVDSHPCRQSSAGLNCIYALYRP